MASIRNLHIQQRQNRRSVQELNQTIVTCTPNTANTSEPARGRLDYIHTIRGATSTSNAERSGKPRTTQRTKEPQEEKEV